MAQSKTYLFYFCMLLWSIGLPNTIQAQAQLAESGAIDTLDLLKNQFPDAPIEKLEEYKNRLTSKAASDSKSSTAQSKDFKKFARQYQTPTLFQNSNLEVQQNNKIRYVSSKKIRKGIEVKGWHPYWLEEAHTTYPYNLLSTISYFSYEIEPITGNYRDQAVIDNWMTTPLIDSARINNCKVLLSVTNFGYENNELFLDSTYAQDAFIERVIKLLEARNAAGIDINFEGMPEGANDKLVAFIKRVHDAFEETGEGYSINLCLPIKDYIKVYDIRRLKRYIEKFSITSYNYEYVKEHKKPLVPLSIHGTNSNDADLSNSVNYYIDEGVNPADLIVAFPYYGASWNARKNTLMSYEHIKRQYKLETPAFDSVTTSMYYRTVENGEVTTCWFENELSLGIKYNWILGNRLGGVGIFALGYDDNDEALWKLIETKFGSNGENTTITPFFRQLKWRYRYSAGFTILFSLALLGFSMMHYVRNWKVQEAVSRERLLRLLFTSAVFGGLLITFIYFFDNWKNGYLLFGTGIILGTLSTFGISWLIAKIMNRTP